MKINGPILQKLQTLEQVLAELRSLGQVCHADLEADWRIRRATERDLQILAEVVIDVCQRLLSLRGEAPAATSADAVSRCIAAGILSDRPAYRKMAQFRNFVVHRYENVDTTVLVDILTHHLTEFEQFRREILHHVNDRAIPNS